jgi:hypothetical protein
MVAKKKPATRPISEGAGSMESEPELTRGEFYDALKKIKKEPSRPAKGKRRTSRAR